MTGRLAAIGIAATCWLGWLVAAPASASEFEQCCVYAHAVAKVNKAWGSHEETYKQLVDRYQGSVERIDQTQAEFARLGSMRQVQQFMLMEAAVRRNSAVTQMNQQTDGATAPATRRETDLRVISATLTQDYLQQQLRELDATGRVVMERRFHALTDLVKVGQEYEEWQKEKQKLIDEYWSIADVPCVRSELEHQAALRELGNATADNPGATVARATLLSHLRQYNEALSELDQLEQYPEWKPMAVTLRARVSMAAGKTDEANRYLRQVSQSAKTDMRIKLLRAQTLSIAGDVPSAISEWSLLLKSKQEEVNARRALVWLITAGSSLSGKEKQEALSHAKVADGLTAGEQWSCQVALALALAASGDKAQSLAACQKAQELAVGSQKTLCRELADQITAGQKPVWKFR